MSDSLWPLGLQHARLPCPSPTLGICSNSCPSSRWCYLIISFSETISLYLWVFNRCCCSFTKSRLTLQDAIDWSMPAHLSFTISQSLSDSCPLSRWYYLIHPLLSLFLLLSIFPNIGVFSSESALHRPNYWSFSIRPANGYSRLILFRIDLFNCLQSKGLSRVFFQYDNLKASILWLSAFFTVQLSHPYMTTGKTIALTIWIFAGKVMSVWFLICCLG